MAYGQGNDVSVITGGPRFFDTLPGRTVTVAFVVSNRTPGSLELIEELDLPQGWQKIIPLSSFRLSPGDSTTRVLAFHVSPAVPAGEYEITYTVHDRQKYSVRDGETLKVRVLPVEDVSLLLEHKPFNVIAGASYEVVLRLINGGNSSDTYRISARSSENLSNVTLSPSEATLDPGQSEVISLHVQTGTEQETTREYLTIEVFSIGEAGKRLDILGVGVDIIGQIDSRADPYHSIPTTLSLFWGGDTGEDGHNGYYLEWSGYGSIDEEGTRIVDFMFRGPEDRGGYFSGRDEYFLNYYQPDLDIFLGDQGYDLSDLTARSTYGRGYGINYRPNAGDFEIGSHYVEDRDDPADNERGFHASYRVNEDLDLRLNYLDKREKVDSRGVKDEILSLQADYYLARYGELLLEYGISDSTRAGSEEDSAYLIEYTNSFSDVSVYVNRIHAGIDYEGYYKGYDYTSAYVSFPIASRLRVGLSYADYEDLVDPDEDSTVFNSRRSWGVNLDYSLGNGWYTGLGYENFREEDQLEPKDEDYTENSVWFRIGRSMALWSYMAEIRRGEKDDHLTNETSRGWNYRIYITHRPSESLFFTLFGDFGDDQVSDIRGLRRSSRVGFSVSWQVRHDWLLNMWYSRSGFDSDTDTEEDEYEIESIHTLRNGHALELALRHQIREDEEDETEYQLTYRIPINIRTVRKKDLGTIEGRIYDTQVGNNQGLANVIVKCQGRTTVTANDGSFILSPLLPGQHVLEIDRQSIGWGRVPDTRIPIIADIVGMGETTNIEIGIVDSCVIAGKVTLVSDPQGEESVTDTYQNSGPALVGTGNAEDYSFSRGLPNILVEIKEGDHVIRRVTDSEGEFRFGDLYPADWILTIYDRSLPPHTYVENALQALSLTPGQEIQVTSRVLPKIRDVQMLVQGEKVKVIK